MTPVADQFYAGMAEEEVQHAREKAENIWAETQEIQRALAALRCPPYATMLQKAAYDQRKLALMNRLAERTEELRRLRAGIKNWNIKLANDETREKFSRMRYCAWQVISQLQRRRKNDPGAWLDFTDDPLEESLDELLSVLATCTRREIAADEWFGPVRPAPLEAQP